MITCPECGQTACDDAKFCDRCGQGLAAAAAPGVENALTVLKPGAVVHGDYRIIEVTGRTATENRYRAEWVGNGTGPRRVQLREQTGPATAERANQDHAAGAADEKASADEDPTGPRAKTAELRRPDAPPPPQAEPATTDADVAADGRASAGSHGISAQQAPGPDSDASAPGPAENAAAASASPRDTAIAAPGSSIAAPGPSAGATAPLSLGEATAQDGGLPAADSLPPGAQQPSGDEPVSEDLGDLFGRVLALSLTVSHPAFHRATAGFADHGRVYLAYPDETLEPLAERRGGLRMSEAEAIAVAVQVCQAVSFLNRRALRLNDICPQSIARAADGRVKLLGLDYVSNDNEIQSEPIPNDGYTAPEVYRGKRVDKRADVFSIGALLYSCLTGERLEAESWREEAGPVRFYPPHVITPELEQAVRRALLFDPAARWPTVEAFKAELVRLNSMVRLRAAVMTDVGMVREHNEDSAMAVEYVRQSLVDPAESHLYVVADGMGGAEAGEVASAIAVAAIRNYVEGGLDGARAHNPMQLLTAALEEANRGIIEYQTAHPEARGMGSTAVSLLVIASEGAVAWVGDSRAYLCEAGGLRQLTRDHSLVQRLIEIGQITPEQARHHEHKNVITRSLGARQSGPAGAEGLALRLKRGDRVMLCSDGLTAHVEDRAIEEILRRHDDPDAAARELVVAANAGGGTDNVSVIVVFAD